jgi:hypothetical protein
LLTINSCPFSADENRDALPGDKNGQGVCRCPFDEAVDLLRVAMTA